MSRQRRRRSSVGFTRYENEVLDALLLLDLSSQERRVFDAIVRKVWGYTDKNGVDKISGSQLSSMTGICVRRVRAALRALKEMKLILTSAENITSITEYRINTCVSDWCSKSHSAKNITSASAKNITHNRKNLKKENTPPTPPGGSEKMPKPEPTLPDREDPGPGQTLTDPSRGKRTSRGRVDERREPDPRVALVVRHYHEAFKREMGFAPMIRGGSCGKIAKTLLEKLSGEGDRSKEVLCELIDLYLREDDEYLITRGYPLELMSSRFNALMLKRGGNGKGAVVPQYQKL